MRTVLLAAAALAAWSSAVYPGERRGSDNEYERVTISNDPRHTARTVFVGADKDMPTTGAWVIALSPTLDEKGNLVVPPTLEKALVEMKKALPHWYVSALRNGKGDYECFVSVNGIDVDIAVNAWFWSSWGIKSEASPLRKQLKKLGISPGSEDGIMQSALSSGFCAFVKTENIGAAMNVIASFESMDEELMRELDK